MYLHPSTHIYLTYYNNDLVCLDLYKDKYTILNETAKSVVEYLIGCKIALQNNKYIAINSQMCPITFHNTVHELISKSIFQKKFYDKQYNKIINKKISYGLKSEDWLVEHSQFSKEINIFNLFLLLIALFKTHILLKFIGINRIIKIINRRKPKKPIYDKILVTQLIHKLNTACLYFPTNTKCLEWSITYIFLAYKQNIPCNLVIGVQTKPFISHAWVEYDGIPFSDSTYIATETARILVEPNINTC